MLSQCHIQHHHQRKSNSKKDRTNVGMFSFGHFRNQLFHHHIQHGTGGKAEQIGQDRDYQLSKQNGEDGADGSDGSDGEDGDSIFSSVTQDDEYVYFNLADGTMITLPKHDKENIQFEDLNVKAICCKNWDANNDGELSYAEAAAVTDIGTVFKGNTEIIAFTEFRYFTGLGFVAEDAFN